MGAEAFKIFRPNLLYLYDDDRQRVERQRFDERQPKNERKLNARTRRGVSSQSFSRRSGRPALS